MLASVLQAIVHESHESNVVKDSSAYCYMKYKHLRWAPFLFPLVRLPQAQSLLPGDSLVILNAQVNDVLPAMTLTDQCNDTPMLQSIMQAPPSQANNDYQLGFVRQFRQVGTSSQTKTGSRRFNVLPSTTITASIGGAWYAKAGPKPFTTPTCYTTIRA